MQLLGHGQRLQARWKFYLESYASLALDLMARLQQIRREEVGSKDSTRLLENVSE